jgi:glucokinase
MLLAGDVGGTKTDVALYSLTAGPRDPVARSSFPTAHFASLESLLTEFLAQVHQPIEAACFGVAGPVVAGQARPTNVPWLIDAAKLRETLTVQSVYLLNDLEALANAVPLLEPSDLHTLNPGEPRPGGAIGVVAPGTGLGEAFLTWDGARYHAFASEGGHADFAPTNPLELDLLGFLRSRFDHVSYERVCSGLGIPNLYAFLKDRGHGVEPARLAAELAAADNPTPIIVRTALGREPGSELCDATLNLFTSILGSEAGNLALKVLATGGIYLGGGIPPRILPYLRHEQFMQSFRGKGRLSELLIRIPVHVILNPAAALLGAAGHGLRTLAA